MRIFINFVIFTNPGLLNFPAKLLAIGICQFNLNFQQTMDCRPKILVASDNRAERTELENILRSLDAEVIFAVDGEAAIANALQNDFILLLTAIQLPDMDASMLQKKLQQHNKKFSVILISDKTNMISYLQNTDFQSADFIIRPLDKTTILDKIAPLVSNYNNGKKLEQTTEEWEAFSYAVSHDLKAPLRAMNGYAHILGESHGDTLNDKVIQLISNIQRNALKMGTLLEDLLTYSRLGQTQVQKTKVKMNALLQNSITEVNRKMPNQAQINVGKLHDAFADVTMAAQLWNELLSNAVKFTSKQASPQITISSSETETEVIYQIEDNGEGFNPDYANKLFEVFKRLHSASAFEGNGMGLAIATKIIDKHHGKIFGESKPKNGAIFRFSLPKKL